MGSHAGLQPGAGFPNQHLRRVGQRIERALRHDHAGRQGADRKLEVIARQRRPLEGQRRSRGGEEAIDQVVLVRPGRFGRWQRDGLHAHVRQRREQQIIEVPHPEASAPHIVHVLERPARKQVDAAQAAHAERLKAGVLELLLELRSQLVDHEVDLVVRTEEAEDPCHAHRGSEALAEHGSRLPIELAASDAVQHRHLVAGDAAQYHLKLPTSPCVAVATSRENEAISRNHEVPSGATVAIRIATGSACAGSAPRSVSRTARRNTSAHCNGGNRSFGRKFRH